MRKLACTVGTAGIALAVSVILLARPTTSYAADHGDATSLATNKAADITDVYTWMSADDADVNLVMDVNPAAASGDHFGTNILYVFHVQAFPAYGGTPTAAPTEIVCKFAADTSVQCWIGATEYLAGDPSSTAGISTTDGKVKLYAGQRNDPFFFNITGLKNVVAAVEGAAADLGPLADGHGCFDLHAAGPGSTNLGAVLVGFLSHQGNGANPPKDDFAGQNVNSIVMTLDKSLLTGGGPVLGVWASTNMIGS